MGATSKLLRFIAAIACVAVVAPEGPSHVAAAQDVTQKLDRVLKVRSTKNRGGSRVIINTGSATSGKAIDHLIRSVGGKVGKRLAGGSSLAAVVPNDALPEIAASPLVERVSLDRVVVATMDRTAETVGAVSARQNFGVDGAGIGVAVIDSGIIGWHDDLADGRGGQRVVDYVDFSGDVVDCGGVAGGGTVPEDGFGHGTHVAGIIAGNGADSDGGITGIAPRAQLIVLKVLDAAGRGHTSDVIAALDYAVSRRAAFNIRVINLSIAAPVYESYNNDPLTLAAERAVRAGITVVAAAGNNGRSRGGRAQYGAITAPGNAPWVLTVGASSHMGTADRADDTIAPFGSRGPTAFDQAAKPDIVAPGVGIESLAAPGSTLYETGTAYLVPGTSPTGGPMPYMSLSGTSMSAAVVSGTAALMMQANPQLTPNAIKAILQYTAQVYAGYDALTEGAGFLNAEGAVALARQFAGRSTKQYADSTRWSRAVTWGNRLTKGGLITASANAWPSGVRWGAERTNTGLKIETRHSLRGYELHAATSGRWRVDGGSAYNVVWGTACRGADCNVPWSLDLVRATADGETVVWGTTDGETVVWGTIDGETVVWGTVDGETVVWGTGCSDPSCAIIWGRP